MADFDSDSSVVINEHPRVYRKPSNVDRAKEEIICPMCISVFDTPLSLNCLHSYCEKCIKSFLESSPNKTSIMCPECRATTLIPEDGVAGLPINFKLQRFVEILSSEDRLNILSQSATLMKQAKAAEPTEQSSLNCVIHDNKHMEYYCEECSLLVCGKCMLDKHRMHQGVVYATEAIPKRIAVMKASLKSVKTTLGNSKTFLETLNTSITELKTNASEAATAVTSYFERVQELLQERKASLLDEISKSSTKMEKIIAKQQQSICVANGELQKCVDVVQTIEENRDSDVTVLLEEDRIRARIEHHESQLELVIANIKIKGSQVFKSPFNSDSYFEDQCKTVGENPYQKPLATLPEDEDQYVTMSPALSPFRSRTQSIVPRTSHDPVSPGSHEQVNIRYSMPTIPRSIPSLGLTRDRSSGFYDNEDVVSADLEGVILPYLEITSRQLLGSSPQLASVYPNGVCIGKPDSLIVSDSRNGILKILTPTGKYLDSVVIESKGDGNLVEPTAVTTCEEGTIFLIIRGPTNKIQKYSSSGQFLMKMKGRNLLGNPTGLLVLPNNNLLVTDSQKGCIHIYDSANGKYLGKLDVTEIYQPNSPSDITRDHRGNLIVADYGYHCVWVYSSNGRYMTRFGKKGTNPGDLLEPYSVAADLNGNIFVAECGNHRISVFTINGKFLCCFGRNGSKPGMFMYPRHLCMDSQGRLVVADEQNHRLQIFDIKDHVSSS